MAHSERLPYLCHTESQRRATAPPRTEKRYVASTSHNFSNPPRNVSAALRNDRRIRAAIRRNVPHSGQRDGLRHGEPVVGANVVAYDAGGRPHGAAVGADGRFAFNCPTKAATLRVSMLGYRNETVKLVPGRTDYDIRLREAPSDVGEVVVTGFVDKKRRVTRAPRMSSSGRRSRTWYTPTC